MTNTGANQGLADALLRLAQHRDAEVWSRIVELAGEDCWHCCLAVCGHASTAEDAFQETLLQVRDDAHQFQPRSADADADARNWLKRVATTTALQVRRSRNRHLQCDQRAGRQMPDRIAIDPGAGMAQDEDLTVLREILAGLDEPRRTAITLHHLHGMSLADVAQELGRPVGTVKTWIHRGMQELQTLLARRGVAVSSVSLLALFASAQTSAAGQAMPATLASGALSRLHAPATAGVHALVLTPSGGISSHIKAAGIVVALVAALSMSVLLGSSGATPAPRAVAQEPTIPPPSPPPPGGTMADAPMRVIPLPDKGSSRHGFEATVIATRAEFESFIKQRPDLGEPLGAAHVDFARETLMLFPFTEGSISTDVAFREPRLEGTRVVWNIDIRENQGISLPAIADYCVALAMRKAAVTTVEMRLSGRAAIIIPLGEEPTASNAKEAEQAAKRQLECATSLGLDKQVTLDLGAGITLDLALIPPGTGIAGKEGISPGAWYFRTPHEVSIPAPYYLGIHEVTQAQYQRIMGTDPGFPKGGSLPASFVSWHDAASFCAKLSELADRRVRLPTEDEWEYACRAGTKTDYYLGDSFVSACAPAAWYQSDSGGAVHPVGGKTPNAWGLHDMLGNVDEWCADHFEPRIAELDPHPDQARVVRGGSFADESWRCTAAYRADAEPTLRNATIGFRIAMDAQANVGGKRRIGSPTDRP